MFLEGDPPASGAGGKSAPVPELEPQLGRTRHLGQLHGRTDQRAPRPLLRVAVKVHPRAARSGVRRSRARCRHADLPSRAVGVPFSPAVLETLGAVPGSGDHYVVEGAALWARVVGLRIAFVYGTGAIVDIGEGPGQVAPRRPVQHKPERDFGAGASRQPRERGHLLREIGNRGEHCPVRPEADEERAGVAVSSVLHRGCEGHLPIGARGAGDSHARDDQIGYPLRAQ